VAGRGLLVLVLAGALVVFTLFHPFYPHVPKANYPPAHDLWTTSNTPPVRVWTSNKTVLRHRELFLLALHDTRELPVSTG
jgi:hypothetical protein